MSHIATMSKNEQDHAQNTKDWENCLVNLNILNIAHVKTKCFIIIIYKNLIEYTHQDFLMLLYSSSCCPALD